jgi:hypothetical protein
LGEWGELGELRRRGTVALWRRQHQHRPRRRTRMAAGLLRWPWRHRRTAARCALCSSGAGCGALLKHLSKSIQIKKASLLNNNSGGVAGPIHKRQLYGHRDRTAAHSSLLLFRLAGFLGQLQHLRPVFAYPNTPPPSGAHDTVGDGHSRHKPQDVPHTHTRPAPPTPHTHVRRTLELG